MDISNPTYAGQAVYTERVLKSYDTVVLRLSSSLVWRCPAFRILSHYDRYVGETHLDIGPGTGFFLDRCRFPVPDPRITLLDPNPTVLEHAAARIARYRPSTRQHDALVPIDLPARSFGSVGLSYVLHCLPGDPTEKAVVLDHVLPLLAPGGVVFGATVLADLETHTRFGRRLMDVYNRKGIFANAADTRADLELALAERFPHYELDVVGAVALFAAWPDEN
ncbi:methyltransferase family protein [Nocardioides albertanoniae]|uniref:Methyltransferase family protein n=1 Tax=Nocardioides albertanoniae TaxID=1175486 RepID=A0A543A7A3_9ACTN|nr:class I SAM-dependent methyltransferase [Nocardioides albertanoniae]TQL68484.1 methyltransferase family protein [Nocardioides albertanoniae]